MNLLPKQISKEEYNYYSAQSVSDLTADIKNLLAKTNGWNFSVNLSGEFISENEFEMTPKWQFVMIRGGEKAISFLKGKIFLNERGRTQVKFTVRPNSTLIIFFFITPIFGIGALISAINSNDKIGLLFLGVTITLLVPLLTLVLGNSAKQGIKDRFVGAFNLTQD